MLITHSETINKPTLILLFTGIALVGIPHFAHLPAPICACFVLMLIWRFIGIWHENWLPKRLWLLLLTVSGMAVLFSHLHGILGRDAGTSFFMMALGLKLLEIHGKREIYLVTFAGFILAASQFLYEQNLILACYILVSCSCILAALISLNSLQSQAWHCIKTAGNIILQALPVTLLAFVLFPRLEAPHWLWLTDQNRAKSGLGTTLEPGSISALSLSDDLVFRVRFNGDPPPPKLRYWRGPIYAYTDGVRWNTSFYGSDKLAQEPIEFLDTPYSYTILMEPQQEAWVFALDLPAKFDAALSRNGLFQLISSKKPGERAEFQITSYPAYRTGRLNEHEQKINLQLPKPASAKLLQLVTELQGFDAAPEVFIHNLLDYFHRENFYYTLTPPLIPDNPIEHFLLEQRSGFCSHYATAFVYLMRIAHIPARVVAGYQGGEDNKMGGFLEVRQADAHAWAEVWLENRGWVRFDPTAVIAPERIERGVNVDLQIARGEANFSTTELNSEALAWLKRSRQMWQTVDYHWQHWVINYNPVSQTRFLTHFGIDDWRSLAIYLAASLLLISGLLSVYLFTNKHRRPDRVLDSYRRFCQKMTKAAIQIKPAEGPRDFAERAKQLRPDLAEQIDQITLLFIRLRYQADAQPNDLLDLRRHIARLRV